jgi:gamma-glutamyltranspeptidase / glutathione hydrolase
MLDVGRWTFAAPPQFLAIAALLFTAGNTLADPVIPGRSVIATRYGIVASSQPLAAAAGVKILDLGGNAIDAAIATNAVVGLTEPTSNGIGGDLFALVYDAKTKRVHALNASGWAPTGLTPEFLAQKGHETMPPRGVFSITVPGAVAGWDALREKFGTLPMSTLLAPAIRLADEGFPVTEITAGHWRTSQPLLSGDPEATKTFLPGGEPPRAGELFRNPALAKSLQRIAARGAVGFYEGETAEAILALSRERGGTFTAADLAEFRAEWSEPISTTYRGWRVYEVGPNTQGIAALMMLNLMERFPMPEWGLHSPDALHTMIEAKKLAYADMLAHVGDPRFAKVPVEAMLDKERAAARAKLIDPQSASPLVEPAKLDGITNSKGTDTIYLTVVDKDGNIVSLIQSNYNGFGSGLVPADCGFMLHNRGALFTVKPDHPNTLAPRKRPLHTIIPAFMEKDGVRIGFGIMGGWNQAQAHAQFVSHIVDHGLTIQQALEAGRFTKPTFEGLDLEIEERIPAASREALTQRGHALHVQSGRPSIFGYGQAVMTTPAGIQFGASDPRHDGAAIPQLGPVGK